MKSVKYGNPVCETQFITDLMETIPINAQTRVLKLLIDYSMKEFARRAKRYRTWYYITKFTSFVAPLVITTITSLPVYGAKFYIVLLSLLASLAVGVSGMGMFHENWIRNRYYCEQLKFEVMQFASDTGEYDGKNPENKTDILGAKIYGILKSENIEWKETAEKEYKEAVADAARAKEAKDGQENKENN